MKISTAAFLAISLAACASTKSAQPSAATGPRPMNPPGADINSEPEPSPTPPTERPADARMQTPAKPSATAAPKSSASRAEPQPMDSKSSALTPVEQGNDQFDLDLTARIRKALMREDALSFTGKNVQVISANGVVTLRGTVHSERERSLIESLAKAEAGSASVDNELDVDK